MVIRGPASAFREIISTGGGASNRAIWRSRSGDAGRLVDFLERLLPDRIKRGQDEVERQRTLPHLLEMKKGSIGQEGRFVLRIAGLDVAQQFGQCGIKGRFAAEVKETFWPADSIRHQGLMPLNSNSVFEGEGLPFAFEQFELMGPFEQMDDNLDKRWSPDGKSSMRQGEMPMKDVVINFPR